MLVLTCPWCGPREEIEFRYGGEAGVTAPAPPAEGAEGAAAAPVDIPGFLFFRSNPKGAFRERWHHSHGCRRWFSVTRSTVTHRLESDGAAIGRYRPEAGS
jgi:heterotetrameric sarcosine oxidase delta subunit